MKIGFPADGRSAVGLPAPGPAEAEPPDELVEMANLPRKDTGVDGTIYISTMQGPHGPRVKWYPERPARDAPCLTLTLEAVPRAINHGLPRARAQQAEQQVRPWVELNRGALLDFWFNGVSWTIDEVHDFTKGLAKLP
jgi:hypothetical protein